MAAWVWKNSIRREKIAKQKAEAEEKQFQEALANQNKLDPICNDGSDNDDTSSSTSTRTTSNDSGNSTDDTVTAAMTAKTTDITSASDSCHQSINKTNSNNCKVSESDQTEHSDNACTAVIEDEAAEHVRNNGEGESESELHGNVDKDAKVWV